MTMTFQRVCGWCEQTFIRMEWALELSSQMLERIFGVNEYHASFSMIRAILRKPQNN